MIEDLVEKLKKVKVEYCLSLKEGFEVSVDNMISCGFYQKIPCKYQGKIIFESQITPIYECNKRSESL